MKHARPGIPAAGIAVVALTLLAAVVTATAPPPVGSAPSPAPGPVVAPNVHGGAR